MRLIERPEWAPHYCLGSLKHEDPEGFVDTELTPTVVDPRVILAVSYVKELARYVGMIDGEIHSKTLDYVEVLCSRITDLETEVSKLEAVLDSCDVLQDFIDSREPAAELAEVTS